MMNNHVLIAMRYMDNPKLFSKDDMRVNVHNSYTLSEPSEADYIYVICRLTSSACIGVTHINNSGFNKSGYSYWLDKFFDESGENKQTYIDEVERLK